MVNQDAVRNELERVVGHEVFSRAKRMRTLLRYLVDRELAGDGEDLKGYRIGVEALGRGADFDPGVDSLVRVEMARLRRMLDAVYDATASDLRIHVDKGGYRPRFDVAAGAASGAIVRPAAVGVVVLPISGGDAAPALATALHQGLLVELARYESLRVLDGGLLEDRAPAERLNAAAVELDCHFLVDGRLQRDGDHYRLLLDARDTTDGTVFWTGRHEGPARSAELLTFLGDTARDISRLVSARSDTDEQQPAAQAQHGEASADCLLRWHAYRTLERTPSANADLEAVVAAAVELEPAFLPGWVILAQLAVDRRAYLMVPRSETEALAERSAYLSSRAVTLDGSNASARHVLARHHRFLGDRERFPELLAQAIERNPSDPELLHHGGTLLAFSGHWEAGAALVARAGFSVQAATGYRVFHILRLLRDGDAAAALALLGDARGFGHVLQLTEAVLRARLGDVDGGRAALAAAGAANPLLADGGVVDQIELWFDDAPLRTLLLEELEALAELA